MDFSTEKMDVITVFTWSMILGLSLVFAFFFKEILVAIISYVCEVIMRTFTTSIEIRTCEEKKPSAVLWLQNVVEHHCGVRLPHLSIGTDILSQIIGKRQCTDLSAVDRNSSSVAVDDTDDLRKQIDLIQVNRGMIFFHKGVPIRVARKVIPALRSYHYPVEIHSITAYGSRNRQMLVEMLDKARKRIEKKPPKQIHYYKYASAKSQWHLIRQFEPRSLSSIVFKEGVTDGIIKDLNDFLENKKWYTDRGIPYRRGYLLYGPPGCGKTSFVKAIAGKIGYDIYELQLSSPELSDTSLTSVMSSIGKNAILLFEDVDAGFLARPQDEARSRETGGPSGQLKIRESKCGSISFSGLLNAIDGAASEEDYIVFMTTNYIEKLDAALIRPGRIDVIQLIDYPDQQQIKSFFQTFYPECGANTANSFAEAVANLNCNPTVAQIQGIFLKHKFAPEDNLEDVPALVDICKINRSPVHMYN